MVAKKQPPMPPAKGAKLPPKNAPGKKGAKGMPPQFGKKKGY